MKRFTLKDLALNAIIGAAYVVLVYIFSSLAYEDVQFRIAEVLLILILFKPDLAFGIILGTFLANLNSTLGIIDSIVGTLATTVGIVGLLAFRKKPVIALFFPVISNAIIVPIMLLKLLEIPYWISFVGVAIGQIVVLYGLGLPLYKYISKRDDLIELLK